MCNPRIIPWNGVAIRNQFNYPFVVNLLVMSLTMCTDSSQKWKSDIASTKDTFHWSLKAEPFCDSVTLLLGKTSLITRDTWFDMTCLIRGPGYLCRTNDGHLSLSERKKKRKSPEGLRCHPSALMSWSLTRLVMTSTPVHTYSTS